MKQLFFIVFLVLLFSSCKKNEAPAPTYPVEGYWTGKFGLGTTTPNTNFTMVIEPGGSIIYGSLPLGSGTIYKGTWTLTGNVLKFTIAVPPLGDYTYQATFSNKGRLESGTTGPGTTTTGYGTWFADRKN